MMERELWCSGDEVFVDGAVLPERLHGALVGGEQEIGWADDVEYLVSEGEDAELDRGHFGAVVEGEGYDGEELWLLCGTDARGCWLCMEAAYHLQNLC